MDLSAPRGHPWDRLSAQRQKNTMKVLLLKVPKSARGWLSPGRARFFRLASSEHHVAENVNADLSIAVR